MTNTERCRAWRVKNLAHRAAYLRKWRIENPKSAAASVEKWKRNNPGGNAAAKRKWRKKNPSVDAAYARKWRAKNRERAQVDARRRAKEHRMKNLATCIKESNDYKEHCRETLFLFFGAQCLRCGFSDRRALHMDHINGLKHGERRLSLSQRYRLVMKDPDTARRTYQVLCANCNVIKSIEQGECKGYKKRIA